jgi:hypothetical protein
VLYFISNFDLGQNILTIRPHISTPLLPQLNHFYCSTFFAESLCPDDLKISLSYNIARLIHEAWAKTLEEKLRKEENAIEQMLKADEELARQLQNEEDAMHHVTKVITMPKRVSSGAGYRSPRRSRSPMARRKYTDAPSSGITFKEELPMLRPRSASPTTGLQQIMDEEIAMKKMRDEQVIMLFVVKPLYYGHSLIEECPHYKGQTDGNDQFGLVTAKGGYTVFYS